MSRRNRTGGTPRGDADSLYGGFNNNPGRNRKQLYESMYYRVLTEIAVNRFKWEGLPPEIDARFMELTLFRQALSVFFYDDDAIAKMNGNANGGFNRYFALRGSGAGKWNMYDNPVSFRVVGNTMMSRTLQAGKQCIPIWGNTLRTPDYDIVYLQSTKLADVERTIEINLTAMRTPFLFGVEDSERQTFVNLWRQVQEGQPVIFGVKGLIDKIDDKVKLFDLGIDREIVINLQLAKSKMWNETMTLLGINNANQDKKERLVTDEVSANDSQIEAVRNSALTARQSAAEIINSKYDLDISVSWNETTPTLEADNLSEMNKQSDIGETE